MPELPSSTPPDGPLASPPVRVPERIDPDHDTRPLKAAEIRARLDARERDIQFHLESLKHEATTLAGVSVGGRPLPDVLRDDAVRNALVAGAVGLALGLLRALRKARTRRRAAEADLDTDLARLRLTVALDDAAERVARRNADPEDALRRALRSVPASYAEAGSGPVHVRESSTGRKVLDVVLTTAAGFAAKYALDLATQELTDHEHEEAFSAVADELDDDGPADPPPARGSVPPAAGGLGEPSPVGA
jgi:hypothetical protein